MEKIMEYNLKGVNFFCVNSPSWQYVKRINSSSHCLIFVIEGTLYMELEGERYAISKNEFLFMPAKKDSTLIMV